MISGKDLIFEVTEDSCAKCAERSALDRTEFFHYTNLEAFAKIIKTSRLLFNRIDHLNDRNENENFSKDELANLAFVSSFSTTNESIPLWHMYTKDNQGLMLHILLKEAPAKRSFFDSKKIIIAQNSKLESKKLDFLGSSNYLDSDLLNWCVEIRQTDVRYVNNRPPVENIFSEKNIKFNITEMGSSKDEAWNYEHETRFIAILRTVADDVEIPDFDYLLVPIKLDEVEKLTICFNPWMSAEMKKCVELLCNEYIDSSYIDKIVFKDSKFANRIIRK